MTRIILIRHGQSEANLKGVFGGNTDFELSGLGIKQAELAAKYLKETENIEKVYCSDLKRAYKTGCVVAEEFGIEITKDKRLREINGGEWEGEPFDSLGQRSDYKIWLSDIGNVKCPGGEAVKDLQIRFKEALCEIAEENKGKTVAVATHATPIRAMMSYIKSGGAEMMKDIPWVSNASLTTLVYEDGKWETEKVSEDSYLKDLKTVFPKNV